MSILLAKRKAQEVLKIFYIKDIYQLDIMSIVGYKEIPVIEKEIKNAEARLQQVEDSGIITINNKISEEGQKRFALAHELGHFELHRGIKSDWLCTEYDMVKRFNQLTKLPVEIQHLVDWGRKLSKISFSAAVKITS